MMDNVLPIIGASLAVIGAIISVIAAHNNNVHRDHIRAMELWDALKESEWMEDHDAAIRNATLKEFERRLQSRKVVRDGEGERCSSYALIEDMLDGREDSIESLRKRGEP